MKRKILCTTIMLSIDGQFMLKEAVTFPSFSFSSTEEYCIPHIFIKPLPLVFIVLDLLLYNCCAQRKKRNKPNHGFHFKQIYTKKSLRSLIQYTVEYKHVVFTIVDKCINGELQYFMHHFYVVVFN